ncbi:DsbE family thiol:disulfide interchange protein [Rhodovulum euryhalinum]|uniref:Cytochrome c biogenesis protein CcmG/thiol:disulfide interchange protein DsbE n=1 Tax=Rhodovulum euryhalinum TaxID=35805 RepID=A0A4R2KF45_9RHOB|nr:DsbE family thiol:disulfide interchange protein [Rhodovulum euryhalinum]TCO70942.1 cytochrome c biogenesis protein CcmG/thiol:disulfide interchange protein DsbE [Rhodovulum euryhalinum]
MAEKKRVSPLMFLPPLIFIGLAALFFVGVSRDDPNALPSTLIGKTAPALALEPLEGAIFGDADLREGGVTLVNFWASWCGPCRDEHPVLEALADEGVTIYGVNYKDKPENAIRFLGQLGNPYAAIAADPSGRTAIEWGVYGVPETFVVDGQGRVVLRHPGPLSPAIIEETLRPAIEKAATGN